MLSIMHPLAPMHPFTEMLDALASDAFAPSLAPAPRLSTTATAHAISLAAPGLSPADVSIEVADGRLSIRGASKVRRIDWSIALPRDADAATATAEVADGLITVRLERKKRVPTHIAVGAGAETDETDEDAYTLTVVAAGFAASDLALRVQDGVLEVSGESTRTGARLEKHVRLPRDADGEKARAVHVDGILTVSVPTKPHAEPQRVAVNATAEKAADKATEEQAAPAPNAEHEQLEKHGEAEAVVDDMVMV